MDTRKKALVTGASSGIGREFAKILAREGYDLLLVARTVSRLEELAQELHTLYPQQKFTAFSCDLVQSTERSALMDKMTHENWHPEVLINNAGCGHYGNFKKTDWSRLHEMLDLNITSLTHLAHFFCRLENPTAQKRYLLNLGSTAAFQSGPFMSVYYATKAYVLSLGVALASELRENRIVVSTLCPGPTDTAFVSHSGANKGKLFHNGQLDDPREVAEFGYRALLNEKAIAVPGLINRILANSNRILSKTLAASIARKFQEPI